jgi:fatty-acyl-CoA synthase
VTSGYFREPQLTQQAFDEQGFFKSGDFGFIDSDARVHYTGRLKEMIKTGGINVSPIQVEDVLLQHHAVRQAHVVGLPDPAHGEVPYAFVEWDPAHPVDVLDLERHCRKRLPAYAVPRGFQFLSDGQFPRTATGKVRKSELVELTSMNAWKRQEARSEQRSN